MGFDIQYFEPQYYNPLTTEVVSGVVQPSYILAADGNYIGVVPEPTPTEIVYKEVGGTE